METERKFFVYVDFREDDGKPFYVGKGLDKRVKFEKRNPLHTNIKNKHGMVRKIVFETHSEQESIEKEIQLIQELKTYFDLGEGGANFTLGGDGISGYKYTDDQKEAKSKQLKKMWEDPEYKELKSESMKKVWEDPEHKKLVSESMKKVWEDPEHREKVSDAIKQHHNDPEFRKKQGEKSREVLSDLKLREKISRITKEKLSDPEIRKKMSENTKLGISKLTPEQRSERIRKGWETRRLQKLQQEIESNS